MKNVKDICEKIWYLENKHNLLDIKVNKVNIWQMIRFTIFNKINKKYGFYEEAHSGMKRNLINQVKKCKNIILNSILKNPFDKKFQGSTLVMEHPRKVKMNEGYADVYSQELVKDMESKDYFSIEYPYMGKHFKSFNDENKSYMDFFYLYAILSLPTALFKFTKKEKKSIIELKELLNKHFQLNINLEKFLYSKIIIFKLKYRFFDKLIKKKNIKRVIVVVSYGNYPLIAAARDNNVEVIEMQHGVITNYHLAYNFGKTNKELNYFPDRLLTFGPYWNNIDGLPNQTKIETYGFGYLNKQLEYYNNVGKQKKQILFISQGTIGKQLGKIAFEIAKTMPDYHFVYKLHPGEYNRWQKEYEALKKASKLNNFEVIDNNEKNLYSYLAESEFQVGVYSTAIFEGLALNCKTILINLPGIDYMEELIEKKYVMWAENEKDFKFCIDHFKTVPVNKNYLFADSNLF